MPVKTYSSLLIIAFVFVFFQPVAGLEIISCAWATNDNSDGSETTVAQQGERKPGEDSKAPGENKTPEPPAITPPQPEEPKPKRGFFDMLHGGMSRRLLSTAEWLDSFFADPRALKEENHTYVRLGYEVFTEEKSGVKYSPTFDLRLVLPQLQNRTHLVFSAPSAALPPGAPPTLNTTGAAVETTQTQDRHAAAAIHYIFKNEADESLIMRVGASLKQYTPALFAAPRYRALFHLKPWDFRFTQEVVYRTDTRWQEETQFDLERPLPHDLFFRTNATGIWIERNRGYTYSLNFSLLQPLDSTHALNYVWSNNYQTRPIDELTEVSVRVAYRHSFWQEWLFFEISPQARFPRDRNFDVTPGILLKVEMFFGVIP